MSFTNYDFNINAMKIANTPDPLGFNITFVDKSSNEMKIKDISKVKASVIKILIFINIISFSL